MICNKLNAVLVPLLLLGQDAAALPTISHLFSRQGIGTTPPPSSLTKTYCPNIQHADPVDGNKWQAGNTAGSGDSLSYTTTYTEGSSFSIGADLGISPSRVIAEAGHALGGSTGLSFSYTESISKSIAIGNSINCPKLNATATASYKCSQIVTPGFIRMRGNFVEIKSNENCPMGLNNKDGGDWELWVPRTDKGENPFYATEPCLCDGPGQDEANHPAVKCLEPCTGVTP